MSKTSSILALVIVIALTIIALKWPLTVIAPETAPTSSSFTPTPSPLTTSDLKITNPQPNQELIVPGTIQVTGEARGSWFFEASFPIILQDANGNTLTTFTAQALEDWMTTDFVSFTAQASLPDVPNTTAAYFVFSKDNPSGLPENDSFVKLPVRLLPQIK